LANSRSQTLIALIVVPTAVAGAAVASTTVEAIRSTETETDRDPPRTTAPVRCDQPARTYETQCPTLRMLAYLTHRHRATTFGCELDLQW